MRTTLVVTLILLFSLTLSCAELREYPVYPDGGEYYDGPGDGGGSYDGGEYDGGGGGGYYPPPPPPKDYGCDWACDATGEWEGFIWEKYRSDGLSLSKKMMAMRVRFVETTYDYSGRHEWVDVDVLIDGRPVASRETQVTSSGYINLASFKNDIDLELRGRFKNNDAEGDVDLSWDEKVENKYTGHVEEYWVRIRGDYDLGLVHGAHWAQAWELFDTYGDGVWDLPDDVWEAATVEGLAHLAEIDDTMVTQPVR